MALVLLFIRAGAGGQLRLSRLFVRRVPVEIKRVVAW